MILKTRAVPPSMHICPGIASDPLLQLNDSNYEEIIFVYLSQVSTVSIHFFQMIRRSVEVVGQLHVGQLGQ